MAVQAGAEQHVYCLPHQVSGWVVASLRSPRSGSSVPGSRLARVAVLSAVRRLEAALHAVPNAAIGGDSKCPSVVDHVQSPAPFPAAFESLADDAFHLS